MTPLQHIDFGDRLADEDVASVFYEYHNRPIFTAMLQYLRDEAYEALNESVAERLKGNQAKSDLALGGFDRLSQCLVKIKALGDVAPKMME